MSETKSLEPFEDEPMEAFDEEQVGPMEDEMYASLIEALIEDTVPVNSFSSSTPTNELESHMRFLTF